MTQPSSPAAWSGSLSLDLSDCRATRSASWAGRFRGEGGGDHWIKRLVPDEQRRLFRETQAVMSLLEGFSDYIMDEVGRDIVPDVERISARSTSGASARPGSSGRWCR